MWANSQTHSPTLFLCNGQQDFGMGSACFTWPGVNSMTPQTHLSLRSSIPAVPMAYLALDSPILSPGGLAELVDALVAWWVTQTKTGPALWKKIVKEELKIDRCEVLSVSWWGLQPQLAVLAVLVAQLYKQTTTGTLPSPCWGLGSAHHTKLPIREK